MRNKKIIQYIICISLTLLIVGCLSKTEKLTESKASMGGSSSGMILLKPIIQAFEEKYPYYKINLLPGTETKDALRGVGNGLIDFGSLARSMKDSEKQDFPNVKEIFFVKDAMVIGVNPSVNITSLTIEQIKKIYAGEIKDWSEVGANQGEIVVLNREESDSSKILLREKIIGPDLVVTSNSILLHSAGSLNKALEETKGSIGPSSLGAITSENLTIKIIALDGVMPTYETISQGTYPLVRSYGLAILDDGQDGIKRDFIDFIFSEQARQIFIDFGLVPIARSS
jgi:phosphate transport system substrate-binding protein